MTGVHRSLIWCTCLVVAGLMIGCKTKTTPTAAGPPAGSATASGSENAEADTGPFAAGKKVFAKNNCARCHKVDDAGPAGPKDKISLAAVGKNHDAAWITKLIRNPQFDGEKRKMPTFDEAKINDTDLSALVDYLASLKGS
jgi:mono/diheme cytochrome c family protein